LNVTVAKFGHDEKYTTSDTGFHINPSRLKSQMIYFVVTAQIVNFALEAIVPTVKRKVFKQVKEFQSSRKGIAIAVIPDAPEEKAFLDRVRNEGELDLYDVTVDLREMCMQVRYSPERSLFSFESHELTEDPVWLSCIILTRLACYCRLVFDQQSC